MKTRIHFEVLNLSKMVLNYWKNLYYYSRLNFILQTAVMGTKYRSGFQSIFDLRINLEMISQVLVGGALTMGSPHRTCLYMYDNFFNLYGGGQANSIFSTGITVPSRY
jgi:hypothetical protein